MVGATECSLPSQGEADYWSVRLRDDLIISVYVFVFTCLFVKYFHSYKSASTEVC